MRDGGQGSMPGFHDGASNEDARRREARRASGSGWTCRGKTDAQAFVSRACAVTVNDYEASLLVERTGWSEPDIARRVQALIVTRGAEGSRVYEGGRVTEIAAAPPTQTLDPTGCGDAYRGGLLHARTLGWSWTDAARLGSVMGAIKIAHRGGQNHPVDRADVARRFEQAYGRAPW